MNSRETKRIAVRLSEEEEQEERILLNLVGPRSGQVTEGGGIISRFRAGVRGILNRSMGARFVVVEMARGRMGKFQGSISAILLRTTSLDWFICRKELGRVTSIPRSTSA